MGFSEFIFGQNAPEVDRPDPMGYQSGTSGNVAWTPEGYQYEGVALTPDQQQRQSYYADLTNRMQVDPSQRLAQTQGQTDRAMMGLKGYADSTKRPDAMMRVGKGRVYQDMMQKIAKSNAVADTERGVASRQLGEQGYQTDFNKNLGMMQYADRFGQQNFQNRLQQQQAAFGGAQQGTNYSLSKYQYDLAEAEQKASTGALGTGLGIVGGVVGGIYGGPAGAAAGYALGSSGGNLISSKVRG